jgi:hypothetical protein
MGFWHDARAGLLSASTTELTVAGDAGDGTAIAKV